MKTLIVILVLAFSSAPLFADNQTAMVLDIIGHRLTKGKMPGDDRSLSWFEKTFKEVLASETLSAEDFRVLERAIGKIYETIGRDSLSYADATKFFERLDDHQIRTKLRHLEESLQERMKKK